MKTITSEKIPIQLWSDSLDEQTLAQAKNLANLPFAHHHIALMADSHVGYGMPIGGVTATRNVVIPNAVGVDIGCGVCASKTSLTAVTKPVLQKIVNKINNKIPLGFKHHKKPKNTNLMPRSDKPLEKTKYPVITREYQKGQHQLGTLGGGNHFIEIQQGGDGYVWLMVHSGSRNIGYQVAKHYNNLAQEYNRRHGSIVPAKWQLDYLPVKSKEGQNYLREMEYCVKFAKYSRREIMLAVYSAITGFLPETSFSEVIDIAHNYAAREFHFGESVIVHRKGATKAEKEEVGIVPGSQGSPSFLVRGLGNASSFNSCSHGAGRKLGRKQAVRTLRLQDEIDNLNRQKILHTIRTKKDLDEAPGAYKNIEEVMNNQKDLVKIELRLLPLAVIKG